MKSFSHIAVIDPAVATAEVDCFNHLVALSPLPMTYHLPALFGMHSLKSAENQLAGIIILGSRSSVHDGLTWQEELTEWLRPKMERAIPTLGICFGHQFICHLYGAPVGFVSPTKIKQQGFRTVRIENSRILGKAMREGQLFVSHRETVTAVPNGFSQIGTSKENILEAFEHKTLPILTVQAHPEATQGLLKNLNYQSTHSLNYGHQLISDFLNYIPPKSMLPRFP